MVHFWCQLVFSLYRTMSRSPDPVNHLTLFVASCLSQSISTQVSTVRAGLWAMLHRHSLVQVMIQLRFTFKRLRFWAARTHICCSFFLGGNRESPCSCYGPPRFTQIPSHTAPPCEALIKYSALLSVSLFGFAVGVSAVQVLQGTLVTSYAFCNVNIDQYSSLQCLAPVYKVWPCSTILYGPFLSFVAVFGCVGGWEWMVLVTFAGRHLHWLRHGGPLDDLWLMAW